MTWFVFVPDPVAYSTPTLQSNSPHLLSSRGRTSKVNLKLKRPVTFVPSNS
jgi:hypothetical protein